jgi:hypothetical protein
MLNRVGVEHQDRHEGKPIDHFIATLGRYLARKRCLIKVDE